MEGERKGYSLSTLDKNMTNPIRVFQGNIGEVPSHDFDAVVISLSSTLKWKESEMYARQVVKEGFKIVWDFDFPFSFPLSDEGQRRSYEFTIDHFKKSLFSQFEKETEGAILYKGTLKFQTIAWTWEEEELFLHEESQTDFHKALFFRDLCFDFLKTLSSAFPDTLALFLLFERGENTTWGEYLALITPLCFDIFKIATKEKLSSKLQVMGWNHGEASLGYFGRSFYSSPPKVFSNSGLLLPHPSHIDEKVLNTLEKLGVEFALRLIPEELLTQEWHGLEKLLIFSQNLSFQGKRKVNGFIAAGGEVIDFLNGEA